MNLLRKYLFGLSGHIPPTSNLMWADTHSTTDRTTFQSNFTYQMRHDTTGVDSPVDIVKVMVSDNEGSSYGVLIGNIGSSSFSDTITTGSKWYKLIVKDTEGYTITSNVLKMTRVMPMDGTMVIEYNGVDYPAGIYTVIPIDFQQSGPVVLKIKNIHSTETILLSGIEPGVNNRSVFIYDAQNLTTIPTIVSSPVDGQILPPGGSLPLVFTKESLMPGRYHMKVYFIMARDGSGNEVNTSIFKTTQLELS